MRVYGAALVLVASLGPAFPVAAHIKKETKERGIRGVQEQVDPDADEIEQCPAPFPDPTTPGFIFCPNVITVSTDIGNCTYQGGKASPAIDDKNCGAKAFYCTLDGSDITGTSCGTLSESAKVGSRKEVLDGPCFKAPGDGAILYHLDDNKITCSLEVWKDNGAAPFECNTTVTVEDNENPTITCPTVEIFTMQQGDSCTAQSSPIPTTADNCGVDAAACSEYTLDAMNGPDSDAQSCMVTDNSGNTAGCTYTATLTDNTAPTITCPTVEIFTMQQGDSCTAQSSPIPTTADNCGVNAAACSEYTLDAMNGPDSDAQSCTVTDNSGNTAGCTYTATLTDDTDPTITCSDFFVPTLLGTCESKSVADGFDSCFHSADDNCAVETLSCDGYGPVSGSLSSVGASTDITCTATDYAGNNETCDSTVTLKDVEAPSIYCEYENGKDYEMDTKLFTASDNCALAKVECMDGDSHVYEWATSAAAASATIDDATSHPPGMHLLNGWGTCTATDMEGNIATCPHNFVPTTPTTTPTP